MEIKGCTALVTGANRGLGKAYADALIARGAAKVYAAARDPSAIMDRRLTPLQLDVTSAKQISAAVAACPDINLLINNAGAMLATSILDPNAEAALRTELEVNVFGVLRMAQAFAPVIARNGGGSIANMLSVVSWYVYPFNATYGATKHAALAITNALRVQLKAQNIHVLGVYAGFIDTEMAAQFRAEKTPPSQVAERTLDGVVRGLDHVHADKRAEDVWAIARSDPAQLEAISQAQWDAGPPWAS
jgi:NAD(P)-dependent dehydrogenase (short-subunit alcohol dehydrogenase family)